ncbi:hypothetical protein [Streptomyces sp. NPDC002133]|uniref:hypothetical protein n=1 Tax=Streptomyces sp. NPDC002133 TaxID=3154409 RepID=UPI003332B671
MMLAAGVQSELLWLAGIGLLTPERTWAAEVGGLDDQGVARDVAYAEGWQLAYEPSLIEVPWNYRTQQGRALRTLTQHWTQVSAVVELLSQRHELSSSDLERLAALPTAPVPAATQPEEEDLRPQT